MFDRYDLSSSLKEATRQKRQGTQDSVYYRITDSTFITKVPMKKLLSHVKTKKELTVFLGERMLENAERDGSREIVAWGYECKGTEKDMAYLSSNQEDADTKIILHALDATISGATEVRIHSPDTDVLVLSLRRYQELCPNTLFVTGRGQNQRVIKLQPIVSCLGSLKTAALPAFHALTGADNTGSFSGKGKATSWKAFDEASEEVIRGISHLGESDRPRSETVTAIEKLVCQFYVPKMNFSTVKELRWWLFRKKQAHSQNSFRLHWLHCSRQFSVPTISCWCGTMTRLQIQPYRRQRSLDGSGKKMKRHGFLLQLRCLPYLMLLFTWFDVSVSRKGAELTDVSAGNRVSSAPISAGVLIVVTTVRMRLMMMTTMIMMMR